MIKFPALLTALVAMFSHSPFSFAGESEQYSFPYSFSGKVIYVEDGDTLTILDAHSRQHSIRLTDLDAPETTHSRYGKVGQPYSRASGNHLKDLAKGRVAAAHCYEFDPYHRLVCRVTVDGVDVSLDQIRNGFAWANRANQRYVRNNLAYDYEAEAKASRRGLWADKNAISPWVWRDLCWKQAHCAGAGE